MNDIDDIWSGLHSGLRAAESLKTWQTNGVGYDLASDYIASCEAGIKALDKLRAQLRDGKKHIEYERTEAPTACYCNATSHPPCSFCVP